MKPTKVRITNERDDFELEFKSESFVMNVENTGISHMSSYINERDVYDSGERQITITGVLLRTNTVERKLNRKVLVL